MLLLVRFSDAITDPIMGFIADRTNHRWGKFRPWLLWSAIPFAVLFWAAFSVPDLSAQGRLIYAVVTYTVLMMAYTMNNVPYSALTGVMTGDSDERTSISAYRFFAAMAAAFIVQGLTLPLVDKFGQGDDAKGWSMTIAIYAVVAVVFFVITFLSVKERIKPPPQQKPDLKQDLADIKQNKAWLAMFWMTLFIFIMLSLRGSSYYYYFTYYVDTDAARDFLDNLGLIATTGGPEVRGLWFKILNALGLVLTREADPSGVGFSLFNMAGNLINIFGVLMAKPLAQRFGKKMVFTVGLTGATILQACLYVLGPKDVNAMFLFWALISLSYGPTIPLLWAMIADTADWSEWKNNRRATGFVYAGIIFALKAGLGLGGALAGWILAGYGYEVATARSPEVLGGIRLMASVYSAIPFALGTIAILYYPITKALNIRMTQELETRHAGFEEQLDS
jgi:Na+/melibiose symporter-like transporter